MTSYALHADTGQGVQLAGFEVASQATLWVTALQPAGDDASGVLRGDAQKAKGQQAHVHQMCNNRAHTTPRLQGKGSSAARLAMC